MKRTGAGAIVWVSVALVCCAGSRAPQLPAVSSPAPARFHTVVVDPGHGGEDRGARGAQGLLEKSLVLDVSRRLAERLIRHGIDVVMTRTSDVFVPLETRTAIANDSRSELFLSIHANSARSPEPRGAETYFVSLEASDANAQAVAERENRAFGAEPGPAAPADPMVAIFGGLIEAEQLRESDAFARLAQQELDRLDRVASRGIKQAPFVVLLGVQMPATLVEIGFLSNPSEERSLRGDARRDAIAEALERAVLAYARRYDAMRGLDR